MNIDPEFTYAVAATLLFVGFGFWQNRRLRAETDRTNRYASAVRDLRIECERINLEMEAANDD